MSDHHAMDSEGPWQAGWLWSLGAAIGAAIVARWLAEVSVQAAVLLGLMVFVVYCVVLAQFWIVRFIAVSTARCQALISCSNTIVPIVLISL